MAIRFTWPLLLLAGFLGPDLSTAAEEQCSATEHRQFDFWLGEWEIHARNRPPGAAEWQDNETWVRTRVTAILDGCAIREESIDRVDGEEVVVGTSVSAYNSHLRKWQQLWVDRQGAVWEYVGGMQDGEMALELEHRSSSGERQTPFEESTRIRMVFTVVGADRLEWRYEYSTDEGATWIATNEAVYTRADSGR